MLVGVAYLALSSLKSNLLNNDANAKIQFTIRKAESSVSGNYRKRLCDKVVRTSPPMHILGPFPNDTSHFSNEGESSPIQRSGLIVLGVLESVFRIVDKIRCHAHNCL